MKKHILLFLFLIPATIWSQYLLPNEEVIYSFENKKKKKMSLVKDKSNKYIQYRFGTKSKIEMEFPANRTKERFK